MFSMTPFTLRWTFSAMAAEVHTRRPQPFDHVALGCLGEPRHDRHRDHAAHAHGSSAPLAAGAVARPLARPARTRSDRRIARRRGWSGGPRRGRRGAPRAGG